MAQDVRLVRFATFGIVGLSSAAAYAGVTWTLVELAHMSRDLANVFAFLCAMSVSYFGHQKFTFRADPLHRVFGPRFLAQAAGTYLVTAGITALGAAMDIHYLVPVAVNLVMIPPTSYLILKLWVFATPQHPPRD